MKGINILSNCTLETLGTLTKTVLLDHIDVTVYIQTLTLTCL